MSLTVSGTAGATNYAGLVVRHGDGSVITRCIAFEESSISGVELLYRSGLSVDVSSSGYGISVYGIDGEGTAEDWSSGRASWSYWHLRGSWVFSPVGASSYNIKHGDVDGWAWGSQTSPVVPPVVTFDQIYRDAYGAPVSPSQPPAGGVQAPNGTASSSTLENGVSAKSDAKTTAGNKQSQSSATGSSSVATLSGRASATTTVNKDRKAQPGEVGWQNPSYLLFGIITGVFSAGIVTAVIRKRRP